MQREQFHYSVELQRDDGQVFTEPVRTYWDPNAEDASAAVATAARAQAIVRSGSPQQRRDFQPISVERVAA